MTLPKSLTTVTFLSKIIAMILFILLPFSGFYFGMEYQKKVGGQQVFLCPEYNSQRCIPQETNALDANPTQTQENINEVSTSSSSLLNPPKNGIEIKKQLTESECSLLGGETINTLDFFDESVNRFVYPTGGPCGGNKYIGEITGLRCPCVCCKRI